MKIKNLTTCLALAAALFASVFLADMPAFADSQFSVSPMNQKIILSPGETYHGSFVVTNPASSDSDFNYKAVPGPFYVDADYHVVYENNGDYNQIVDWIEIPEPTGTIKPNSSKEIDFLIHVPKDSPVGGQYATITVGSNNENDNPTGTINLQTTFNIAHIIFAEIAGSTVRKGEVNNISVPGFIFSGNLYGTSSIKNTGNVHGQGKYTLQVFPLFSEEEVYTNEEEPEYKNILPETTLNNTSYWFETPTIGIFNVIYTAEFEGVTSQVKKMVIVCPIWLLITVVAVIVLLIFWIIGKGRKKNK